MATTTPNYGWTVPTSTDLVKDGATAIETLGDAIDASMNTALGTKKAGMVLLQSLSFSGVASQSINDVFSATYDNYRIVSSFVLSNSASVITMRLRASGTDNSTANYGSGVLWSQTTGTVTSNVNLSQTSFTLSTNQGVTNRGLDLVCFSPFATAGTDLTGTINVNRFPHVTSCRFSATNSFDGFTLISSLGDITGSISVYAFNQ